MPASFIVDPESPVPIFRQIVDGLRAAISRGALESGGLLPSVRALAEELGVNPNTVHRAFGELEREGLVTAERGRGMVIRDGTRPSAKANGEEAVLLRLADAVRHARAVGVNDQQFKSLLRKAQRLVESDGQEKR